MKYYLLSNVDVDVNVSYVVVALIGFIWLLHMSEEAFPMSDEAYYMFSCVRDPYLYFRVWFISRTLGVRFYLPVRSGFVFLKGGTHDMYRRFTERCDVKFLGIHQISAMNYNGVLHPIDFFLKHFYDRFFPVECAEAMTTYKRTNPTLGLRLDYLNKFGSVYPRTFKMDELRESLDELCDEVMQASGFSQMLDKVRYSVNFECFSDLNVDMSSAAGFPYVHGVKRREAYGDAIEQAAYMMHDMNAFEEYSEAHVWYTTGRAKLQDVGKAPSGRLISYAGFAYMLIAMLLVQPWAAFMNTLEWCGVGWSWMHGGADKFARKFRANKGRAPEGFRYVSVDIKEWDTKLGGDIMRLLVHFYTWLMERAGLNEAYVKRFLVIVEDMICAKILFPLGYLFQVFQGMKSGWCNTANDNTLLHKLVFNAIMRRIGYMLHVLYGDDNFLLVPDHISDGDLVNEYARFGLIVGTIHSSVWLHEVDFLSKYVHYDSESGHYFIYRPRVESHARMLMPEEMDPAFRSRPDSLIAAERCLGHLLDNPFNGNVRHVCYTLLAKLKKHYHIEYVSVTPEMKKKHPWRQFEDLPSEIPTVPDVSFIEELYGVHVHPITFSWPAVHPLHSCDPAIREDDSLMFDQAMSVVTSTAFKVNQMSRRRRKRLVRDCSPFVVPHSTYGTHGARFEFAVRFFELKFRNALDLGAHPGASAFSMLKVCDDVTCVTLPLSDPEDEVCPYVFRDEAVTVIECDANAFECEKCYDVIHDDVDVAGRRANFHDVMLGRDALSRARKFCGNCNVYLMTVRHITPELILDMYQTYQHYGYIDMVKPVFSCPWKCEFMICFKKRRSGVLMKKGIFIRMVNAFLNRHAASLIRWNELILYAARLKEPIVNPIRGDFDFQNSLSKWLIPPRS